MTPFQGKLRIRHLEIMLAVADFGNLSKAAAQLHLTQSGLSRALIDIEESVGGQLFERSSQGVRPTALGLTFCRHANRLLGELRKAELELAAVQRGDIGNLAIGCFSMFSAWPLPEAVHAFHQTLPRVSLNVEVSTHEKLLEDLDAGGLDAVISRSPAGLYPGIYRSTPLLHDPVVLACSQSHVLAGQTTPSLEECLRHPWTTALPQNRIRLELVSKLREEGHPLPRLIGAVSLDFCREMMNTNVYLCMMPGSVAHVLATRGQLHCIPLDLGLTRSPLSIIWRRDRSSTRQMRTFAAHLARIVKTEATRFPWR